jgi:cytidylate kinase
MVIAIDGPAGAGKSTVARALARELGFTYLDSGAMYRCVALLALARPQAEPGRLARAAAIELERARGPARRPAAGGATLLEAETAGATGDWGGVVRLDGRDVTAAIRTPEVSAMASRVAADPDVRAALVARQRELLATGDWVAEGRDIGTVVAPDAELKVFLTADAGERARRRTRQSGGDPQAILAEQRERDERDATRVHSPLRAAADAVEVDTTGLGADEVVRQISALAGRVASRRG